MANPTQTSSARNGGLTHFDTEAALHLVQALHRELELEPFLTNLYSQMRALTNAQGLAFKYPLFGVDILVGERGRHTAEYNLQYNGDSLGALTIFYARRANEQEIATAEDLLGLVMAAVKNCLTVLELRNGTPHPTHPLTVAERSALETGDHKSDALILVALDNYETVRTRAGEEWASTLMSSVHTHILDGLRASDGVYQISEDLVAVLLANTTLDTAREVAAKIRSLVAELHLDSDDLSQRLTACMGITDAQHATDADDVMTNARTALHAAQAKGTNQIETFSTSA